MYGEWVTLFADDETLEVRVFVSCTPNTPIAEKRIHARNLLRSMLGRHEALP